MAHEYHFRHHLIEARRNRSRLLVAIAVIVAGAALYLSPSMLSLGASSTTTDLQGYKIDDLSSSSGGPYKSATVTVRRVSNGATKSVSDNPFYFKDLPASAGGEHYIVSVSPTTLNGYTIKGLTWCLSPCSGYNQQTTNFRSGSSTEFILQPGKVYNMRWIYQKVATPTPAPTPTPKPTATPVPATPTPKPATPKPTVKATSRPVVTAAPVTTPAPAADTVSPSTPGNFQALVASDNALVNLSWAAASDNVAVTGYKLERSVDQKTWLPLADKVAALNFRDDTVAFAVEYYYRLSALDAAGNVSGYATSQGRTGEFAANSDSEMNSYFSDDQIAQVDLEAGTLTSEANCTVAAADMKVPGKQSLVAGPYSLLCKDSSGGIITDLNKPVTWRFALKSKMKGFTNPTAVSIDSSGATGQVKGATYDSKTQILTFNQTAATTTAVLASVQRGISPAVIIVIAFVILLIVGVFIVILRSKQRQNYNDYLRRKYYEL